MNSSRRDFIKTFILGIFTTGSAFSLLSCENNKKLLNAESKYQDGIEIAKGYWVLQPEIQNNIVPLASAILPGIENINIKDKFMEKMSKNHGEAGFFDAGLWNINNISKLEYKKPFYQLDNKKQILKVVSSINKSNKPFFNRFKKELITIYYSNQLAWKKLNYTGPPQPVGFPDYHKKPTV